MAEKLYQGALKHPNIIKLIHAQLSDLTLVSELAKFDLHWVLFERKRSLTTRTKRLIPPQLIDALAYMHSQEIVHQDLKYENIVFINATTVKIIDFGLAATIKLDENGEEIAAKNRAGTSRYWSPQKLAGTPILATKEDVFSLAQMLLAIEVGNPWDKPDKRMRAYRNWVKNPMADERFATLATQQEEYYLLLRWMLNHDQEGRCSALEAKESRYMKTACFQKRGRKRPRKIALGVL
ncbi:hypothetical protein L596_025060 [Steinernema carpocapsae]|uniref:Protein kinase domain-containing protein n=1 Tax=Steinernema carpocapsae TaxID=34508 RepID=A0A4U5M6P1_STECR|nr:hypothetical protein L596_025060 [Steinernema carpocapsae]